MKNNKPRVILPWVCAAAVILFTLLMSSLNETSSHGISRAVTERLVKQIQPLIDYLRDAPDWRILADINNTLRKAAHIITYFGLTVFVTLGFRALTSKSSVVFAGSFFITLVCAAVDELHQVFVKGRGASVGDILLDMIGVLLALVCVVIYKAVKCILRWLTKK